MKIRTGFVSNSSSSSFVLVVEKRAHNDAMKEMEKDPNFKLLNTVFERCVKEKRFCDVDTLVITGGDYEDYNVIGNLNTEDVDYQGAGYDYLYEYWEEIVDPLWYNYLNNIPESCKFLIWSD